jgi:hypothetical protein
MRDNLDAHTLDQFVPSIVYTWARIAHVIDFAWVWDKHCSILIVCRSTGEDYFLEFDQVP